jgi:hypothetical protein
VNADFDEPLRVSRIEKEELALKVVTANLRIILVLL